MTPGRWRVKQAVPGTKSNPTTYSRKKSDYGIKYPVKGTNPYKKAQTPAAFPPHSHQPLHFLMRSRAACQTSCAFFVLLKSRSSRFVSTSRRSRPNLPPVRSPSSLASSPLCIRASAALICSATAALPAAAWSASSSCCFVASLMMASVLSNSHRWAGGGVHGAQAKHSRRGGSRLWYFRLKWFLDLVPGSHVQVWRPEWLNLTRSRTATYRDTGQGTGTGTCTWYDRMSKDYWSRQAVIHTCMLAHRA